MVGHNAGDGRHRDRQSAVGRADRARALVERGDRAAGDSQVIQADASREDVYDGVNCPHLVKADPVERGPMDLGLGLCEDAKDPPGPVLGPLAGAGRVDDGEDLGQTPVGMELALRMAIALIAGLVPLVSK